MKKSILLFLAICFLSFNQVNSQGFLKKVTKSMTNELLGKPQEGTSNNKNSNQPEPACACKDAVIAMDMGGKVQLDYSEITISVSDDGRLLAKHRYMDEYYVIQNGVTIGPLQPGDKRLKEFRDVKSDAPVTEENPWADNQYISKSGDKYMITFRGKTYGPYALINKFVITKSNDKFAAIVIENMAVTADQGKKMDEAIKNAKTEQEKMDLTMQYAQQMQQKIFQGGGPESITPKVVTNIPGSTFNPNLGGTIDGNMKYDDILVNKFDKITDLQERTVIAIDKETLGAEQIFINTGNTKYAAYKYGTLTFSDKTTLSEMFNLYLIKENGQVYLTYMYYSPKKNAIMQCRIPF